ncbi:hypothetical protein [Streptomyces lavendulae]|uniref:hypothetical protein n=1 Tax=Streptomyces lavendulae TaxID=1914 RepID=UPI00249FCC86|nr:hypothetical protein [Streptomyces lavendulae]GLX22646.1 hypothetical protein Slala01_62900 [Streptomyces lavendulae subsp. lavendulae]GLX30129.1 hypothetical protein Slala02_59490 [Streptomyces lavendulae subsp. lavendulae]
MPDAPKYTPYSIYILEPDAYRATAENGYVPIEAIAERVYGKPYSALRGCQRDDEHIGADTAKLYELTSDDDYLKALGDFDDTELYLGWDSRTGESVIKTGMTELDYWLSIRVADENTPATVEANPPETQDLENAVFEDRFFANRAFSPSLRLVLADLIRRGELPRGDYLFRLSW